MDGIPLARARSATSTIRLLPVVNCLEYPALTALLGFRYSVPQACTVLSLLHNKPYGGLDLACTDHCLFCEGLPYA